MQLLSESESKKKKKKMQRSERMSSRKRDAVMAPPATLVWFVTGDLLLLVLSSGFVDNLQKLKKGRAARGGPFLCKDAAGVHDWEARGMWNNVDEVASFCCIHSGSFQRWIHVFVLPVERACGCTYVCVCV